jgi:hypothetical protein
MSTISLLFVFLFQQPMGDTVPRAPQQSVLFIKRKNYSNTLSNQLLLIIPPPTQGFFCNFEDQIQRKKVPIDFGLKLK